MFLYVWKIDASLKFSDEENELFMKIVSSGGLYDDQCQLLLRFFGTEDTARSLLLGYITAPTFPNAVSQFPNSFIFGFSNKIQTEKYACTYSLGFLTIFFENTEFFETEMKFFQRQIRTHTYSFEDFCIQLLENKNLFDQTVQELSFLRTVFKQDIDETFRLRMRSSILQSLALCWDVSVKTVLLSSVIKNTTPEELQIITQHLTMSSERARPFIDLFLSSDDETQDALLPAVCRIYPLSRDIVVCFTEFLDKLADEALNASTPEEFLYYNRLLRVILGLDNNRVRRDWLQQFPAKTQKKIRDAFNHVTMGFREPEKKVAKAR